MRSVNTICGTVLLYGVLCTGYVLDLETPEFQQQSRGIDLRTLSFIPESTSSTNGYLNKEKIRDGGSLAFSSVLSNTTNDRIEDLNQKSDIKGAKAAKLTENTLRTIYIAEHVSHDQIAPSTDDYLEEYISIPQLCDGDSWLPLYINDSTHRLYLECCLKFIILDPSNKYEGTILDMSRFSVFADVHNIGKALSTTVSMCSEQSVECWYLDLQIKKTSTGNYYWDQLTFSYHIKYTTNFATAKNIRRYEAKLDGSYECQYEDTIMLGNQAAVVVKGLRYRAFREADTDFPDRDISHCPSSRWEFLGILIFIGIIVCATIVTVLWKCVKQVRKYNETSSAYREFGRRFEP